MKILQIITESSPPNLMAAFEDFLPLAMAVLKIDKLPPIKIVKDVPGSQPSFGGFDQDSGIIYLQITNRHPLDIFRTLAHELVHFKQKTEHKLDGQSGATGSPEENEANATAGIVMRHFNKKYPQYLSHKPLIKEDASNYEIHDYKKLDNILMLLCKMVIKGQKKDKDYYGMVAACVLDPDNNIVAKVNYPTDDGKRVHAERAAMEAYQAKYGEIPEGSIIITTLSPCNEISDETADGRSGNNCTDLINHSPVRKVYCGYMDPSQGNEAHTERDFNLMETENGKMRDLCKSFADTFLDEDYHPNDTPPGPETPPTMPAGTVRVDVSDVYDWYKLGKNIANLKQAKASDFGKGPPSTIMAFGSEPEEHKYINNLKKLGLTTTDIDPLDPKQPKKMPRQKIDRTYNVGMAENLTPNTIHKLADRKGVKWDNEPSFLRLTKQLTGKEHLDDLDQADLQKVKHYLEKQSVAEGATVTRIDSKPITDFGSSLKAYKHTDDWSQSGVDTGDDSYWKNKNLKTNTTKGLFAGDPKRTALYATGNAHETRYVEFTQNGQPIVYFDQKDLPAMRSRKTYLTVFDANDFRQLPTGEWFSENPGKPIKQISIGDPFKYIASQGWIVRVTDDLDKVFKQVKNMHKAGKIAQYGAEGMNESKQGVAENFADGKNPGRKGLAKRSGVNTKASVSDLRKTAKNSSGEKQRMAHWLANMKAGKAKKK